MGVRSLCSADLVRQRNDDGGNSFWAIAFSHTNERNGGEMSEAADARGLTMHERERGGRDSAQRGRIVIAREPRPPRYHFSLDADRIFKHRFVARFVLCNVAAAAADGEMRGG